MWTSVGSNIDKGESDFAQFIYPSDALGSSWVSSGAFSSWQEKRNAFQMQKVFAKANDADALIQAAPENQPYRNELEIRNLFARLSIPISQLGSYDNCHLVRI